METNPAKSLKQTGSSLSSISSPTKKPQADLKKMTVKSHSGLSSPNKPRIVSSSHYRFDELSRFEKELLLGSSKYYSSMKDGSNSVTMSTVAVSHPNPSKMLVVKKSSFESVKSSGDLENRRISATAAAFMSEPGVSIKCVISNSSKNSSHSTYSNNSKE